MGSDIHTLWSRFLISHKAITSLLMLLFSLFTKADWGVDFRFNCFLPNRLKICSFRSNESVFQIHFKMHAIRFCESKRVDTDGFKSAIWHEWQTMIRLNQISIQTQCVKTPALWVIMTYTCFRFNGWQKKEIMNRISNEHEWNLFD